MRHWAQKLSVVLATGYILFFYSERVFWSFLRPGDKLTDLFFGWLIYSVLAWVFLVLVRQCRVGVFPAVFLAGAIFGWLAEGVVVDTMYGSKDNPFPASISFTGLAWHALISVGVGWYWQAKLLAGGNVRKTALFAAVVGLGWALWAGWWPAELGKSNTSLAAFAGHTMAVSLPLFLSWVILGSAAPSWFRPARFELPILLGVVGLFFVLVRVPATPRSALMLPPLLLACAYGLRRNQRHEPGRDFVEAVLGQFRFRSCLPLLLMPVTAIACYAPVPLLGLALPTNWVLYVVTMPLGFLFLFRSLWMLHRATPRTSVPEAPH